MVRGPAKERQDSRRPDAASAPRRVGRPGSRAYDSRSVRPRDVRVARSWDQGRALRHRADELGRDFYLKWWKQAVTKAGLPAKLRFHDLRHTCAALLIAANVPAKAIQAHLGHSSFKITMDTYGHLYEDASDHVANAMNAAFAAPTAPEPANLRAIR
ncbi:tyrosine-type recombinase/integrase [Rhodococcus hoagii]|nr:tyrosine-type recombinase/integrase [Prescottella equi]